jgi:hypothetical protein
MITAAIAAHLVNTEIGAPCARQDYSLWSFVWA